MRFLLALCFSASVMAVVAVVVKGIDSPIVEISPDGCHQVLMIRDKREVSIPCDQFDMSNQHSVRHVATIAERRR